MIIPQSTFSESVVFIDGENKGRGVVLDGQAKTRILSIKEGNKVSVCNVGFTGGADGEGSAVECLGAQLIMSRCSVSDCTAGCREQFRSDWTAQGLKGRCASACKMVE